MFHCFKHRKASPLRQSYEIREQGFPIYTRIGLERWPDRITEHADNPTVEDHWTDNSVANIQAVLKTYSRDNPRGVFLGPNIFANSGIVSV